MGYSTIANNVRVDIFKESGKWVETIALRWQEYDGYIHDEFRESWSAQVGDRYKGCLVVCLHPYNENAHPLMMKV